MIVPEMNPIYTDDPKNPIRVLDTPNSADI